MGCAVIMLPEQRSARCVLNGWRVPEHLEATETALGYLTVCGPSHIP